jgi:DNA repair exonuclease SbcCD ATPase subunit
MVSKYKSRATRCGEATGLLGSAAERLREVAETLRDDYPDTADGEAKLRKQLTDAEADYENGKSDLEGLKEEIESWKDNMEGANMEHLPKFEEVSECYDQISAATDGLDSVEIPEWATDPKEGFDIEQLADELESAADEIDSAIAEAEAASFPGMY